MRPDSAVMASPALHHDLSLLQSIEDLAVEQLVAEPRIEALNEAVLPRAAGLDLGGARTDRGDPALPGLGSVIGFVAHWVIGFVAHWEGGGGVRPNRPRSGQRARAGGHGPATGL